MCEQTGNAAGSEPADFSLLACQAKQSHVHGLKLHKKALHSRTGNEEPHCFSDTNAANYSTKNQLLQGEKGNRALFLSKIPPRMGLTRAKVSGILIGNERRKSFPAIS
jgi:hypothetical protein